MSFGQTRLARGFRSVFHRKSLPLSASAMFLAAALPAAAGPGGLGDVVLSSGTYTQSVPIEVPPYHGLEPKLAISYSSQGGNGFAGVGWSLSGFSVIDAPGVASPGPYLLDGQPLVACVAGSVSPSCTTATPSMNGFYSTKVESYLRIKFDSTANTWTVWGAPRAS
jgi:virulence plasmid B protein